MNTKFNSNKKYVLVFPKLFWPRNVGFANSALGFVRCIQQHTSYVPIVITDEEGPVDGIEPDGLVVLRARPFEQRANESIAKVPSKSRKVTSWDVVNSRLFRKTLKMLTKCIGLHRYLMEKEIVLLENAQQKRNQEALDSRINEVVSRERKRSDALYDLASRCVRDNQVTCAVFLTNRFPFLGPQVVDLMDGGCAFRLHSTEDTERVAFGLTRDPVEKWHRNMAFEFCEKSLNILSTTFFYLDFFRRQIMRDNTYSIASKGMLEVLPNTAPNEDELIDYRSVRLRMMSNGSAGEYALFLGKMSSVGVWQKGVLDLVFALSELKKMKRLPEDMRVLLIGSGDGSTKVKRAIAASELENCVSMLEATSHSETIAYLASCRYVVLPSRFEGQSMFLTEALGVGVPIITSRNTGASDMVLEGVNGMKHDAQNIIELAACVEEMWHKSSETLHEYSKQSSKLYDDRYSNAVVGKKIESVLSRLELCRKIYSNAEN